jgi:hypothetical protein
MSWKRNHNGTHAAYMREWRKSRPMTGEQRKKDAVRSYANVYLKRGLITKEGCAVCGVGAQMHHPDYGRPTHVVWLCKKHHQDLHDWPIFLAAAREPSGGEEDERAVDRQRPKPKRIGRLDRDVGQADRADDRHEEAQPHRQDDREDVDRA